MVGVFLSAKKFGQPNINSPESRKVAYNGGILIAEVTVMPVFYHLITRQAVHERQVFDFSKGQANWQGKFFLERGEQLPLDALLKTPRLTLTPAQTTQLRNDRDRQKHALRETILEMVRLRDHPDYPSRLACLYAANSYDQALTWRNLFEKEGRHVLQLVQVATNGPTFSGDATLLPATDGTAVSMKLKAAEHYWNTPIHTKELSEVLLGGRIVVERIVRTF